MRLFRMTYKGKDGGIRRAKTWSVEFRDHKDRLRSFAGYKDKRQTEELGRNIERLVTYRSTNSPPDAEMLKWVEVMRPKLRKKLAAIGLLDVQRVAAGRSLIDHLEGEYVDEKNRPAVAPAGGPVPASWKLVTPGFRQHLAGKGNTPDYVNLRVARARKVIEGCGFHNWSELSSSKIINYLKEQRDGAAKISHQTSNFYLQSIKQFAKWMVKDGRAQASPIDYVDGLNVKTDRRHDRRAASLEEALQLLKTTAGGPVRFGMTGADRVMLYRLDIETGLRANEIRTLTARQCHLDVNEPYVVVVASYAKARRERLVPLKTSTAAAFKEFVKGKLPDARILPVPRRYETAPMLRQDLAAAREAWIAEAPTEKEKRKREESDFLKYQDSRGLFLDFHGLRHTRGVWLFEHHKAHPREVQELMGVGSLALVDRYTRSFRLAGNQVVERGPELSVPDEKDKQQKAG